MKTSSLNGRHPGGYSVLRQRSGILHLRREGLGRSFGMEREGFECICLWGRFRGGPGGQMSIFGGGFPGGGAGRGGRTLCIRYSLLRKFNCKGDNWIK